MYMKKSGIEMGIMSTTRHRIVNEDSVFQWSIMKTFE